MRILGFLSTLLVMQCTSPEANTGSSASYFDVTSFTQNLIEQQFQRGASVVKTTNVNGVIEERLISDTDSLFWVTELTPLLNADINKPSLKEAYLVEIEVEEVNSNLLKTIYSAQPSLKSKVKLIEIKYLGKPEEVRQIFAVMQTDNPVYSTHQSIHIWINNQEGKLIIDSLKIEGFNKTVLLDSMVYSSTINLSSG
ncbi:MAG: hypothetical protein L3J29_12250 [Cyclobacteriaceae bacterium]|nr:hypothetical protein [Cyclobacteriaceae bacterium]